MIVSILPPHGQHITFLFHRNNNNAWCVYVMLISWAEAVLVTFSGDFSPFPIYGILCRLEIPVRCADNQLFIHR
jgi:hypothetical protein